MKRTYEINKIEIVNLHNIKTSKSQTVTMCPQRTFQCEQTIMQDNPQKSRLHSLRNYFKKFNPKRAKTSIAEPISIVQKNKNISTATPSNRKKIDSRRNTKVLTEGQEKQFHQSFKKRVTKSSIRQRRNTKQEVTNTLKQEKQQIIFSKPIINQDLQLKRKNSFKVGKKIDLIKQMTPFGKYESDNSLYQLQKYYNYCKKKESIDKHKNICDNKYSKKNCKGSFKKIEEEGEVLFKEVRQIRKQLHQRKQLKIIEKQTLGVVGNIKQIKENVTFSTSVSLSLQKFPSKNSQSISKKRLRYIQDKEQAFVVDINAWDFQKQKQEDLS